MDPATITLGSTAPPEKPKAAGNVHGWLVDLFLSALKGDLGRNGEWITAAELTAPKRSDASNAAGGYVTAIRERMSAEGYVLAPYAEGKLAGKPLTIGQTVRPVIDVNPYVETTDAETGKVTWVADDDLPWQWGIEVKVDTDAIRAAAKVNATEGEGETEGDGSGEGEPQPPTEGEPNPGA